MVEIKEEIERVILVAVATAEADDTEESLRELAELAKTAGAVPLENMIQHRERIHPGTYLGQGKLEELRVRLEATGATGIICDDELTPAQMKNLERELETKIMDRTMVILDIFASRAKTREGQLQVELAQLKYRSAKLVGSGISLSRLGGGIGTRGPGESKLESDRRVIRSRISFLKQELETVVRHREVTRGRRAKNQAVVVAIVGYTNAGKSTLLNTLTSANILAEDKLFATLDPTTRGLILPTGEEILLTDTVGFIRKLPHHLIEAFRSTLEEAKYADVLLHVVDSSDAQSESHMRVVYETLSDLGIEGKPILTLFNKADAPTANPSLKDNRADATINISAKTGEGLEEMQILLSHILREKQVYVEKIYPYADAGKIQDIRRMGRIVTETYEEDGIHIAAYVPVEWAKAFS